MSRFLTAAVMVISCLAPAWGDLPEGHPRLLVGADDVPALREKVRAEPISHMFDAIRKQADGAEFDPDHAARGMYDMGLRDWAQMYLLTGDAKYADRAAAATRVLMDDKDFWLNPQSKGLTRAAGAFSVALAYDMCHDAWPAGFRKEVSRALFKIAGELMQSMGEGANTRIGNNWQGVRYGAAGMAALACDEPGREKIAREAYANLLRHLRANLSGGGWNPEGIGYMIYPATFTGPFGIAAARAGLGDVRKDVPAYGLSYWASLVGTVNIPQIYGLGLRADLADDHPGYKPDGTLGLAFYYTPMEQQRAVKWMYDYLVGERGNESYDVNDWAGGIYSVLYYPVETEAQNPAESAGLHYLDRDSGVAIFRERYKDEGDIVALVNATQRRADGGHAGPDVNTFRILGRGGFFVTGGGRTGDTAGQTNLFAGEPAKSGTSALGQLVEVAFDEAGGGGRAVVRGSSMGVQDHVRRFAADYSGKAGAPALFLNSDTSIDGKLWRLNTPEFNKITTHDRGFVITSPNGSTFAVAVLEPARPTFRTGTVERGGGLSHAGFPYRGTKYANNTYIEFDVEARAAVVMTLQDGPPPKVHVEHGLHGVEARVGDVVIAYEKNSGEWFTGEAVARLAVLERNHPLRPLTLQARARGDAAIALNWTVGGTAATGLRLERRAAENQAAAFEPVANLPADATHAVDRAPKPATAYEYRVVAVNASGDSDPSPTAIATTFDEGYVRLVEDFSSKDDTQSLGVWQFSNGDRGWSLVDQEGSTRDAHATDGYLSTGSVRISNTNVFYTEDIRMDMSGTTAAVVFDWRAQAVTQLGVILKLADGQWIATGRFYAETSRVDWRTKQFDLAEVKSWQLADPVRRTLGEKVEVSAADLADIRGVGVWGSWPINQKWAHVDQLTLVGKPLK